MAAMPAAARVFVIVMDACGVGALPDAHEYGDAGADTLGHLAQSVGGLRLPALERLGLGSVAPIEGLAPVAAPGPHGRLHREGPGKDSTTGHWELMGVILTEPLPTYPDGFPQAIVARLAEATGHRFCANAPLNGLEAIEEYGDHHLATGELILYTSQDSVAQIAAHEDVLSADDLYDVCARAREVMSGADAVGRVIARPFTGTPGAFARTDGRHDLSVMPPGYSALDAAQAAGVPVHGVGKISDLFAGRGVDVSHPGPTNAVALAATDALVADLTHGFVLVNLVDTDQLYGHRKDAAGFADALEVIDGHIDGWVQSLRPDDLLIVTADHGCDVTTTHSDHTREYVPLLALGGGVAPRRHDGAMADVGASALGRLGVPWPAGAHGRSFVT